jgi:hypothetical protein
VEDAEMVGQNEVPSADLGRLTGVWRLRSFSIEAQESGERMPMFGGASKGRLVLTESGVLITVITAVNRPIPKTNEDRAVAFNTVIAYTGHFKVKGDEFTTNVDVSWNEAWTHAPQIRCFRFVGAYLEILSAWAPNPVDGKSMGRGILEWERET